MRLLEFINTVNIFEAARDRYAQMFTNLIPLANQHGTQEAFDRDIKTEINWAMNVLKKQDKIVWYLRLAKVGMLHHRTKRAREMAADFGDDSDVGPAALKTANFFQSAYDKVLGQLAKKMGIAPNLAEVSVENAMGHVFKREMEHLMSLNIPAYDEYVFSNQSPDQIFADWYPIENAWIKKRKATMPIDREGIDTIIKYPDGSEWVNLNKEYCSAEGDAMGHCGNSADPKEGDRVLSYRTIEDVDGEQVWKPRLTFVLDKNGLLGETKGRANQKPDKKYHDVIVDLLRQDFVKGIKGGGYDAHNNFHFNDLSPEVREELAEEKPELAPISYSYNKHGMTKDLLNRVKATWDDARYRTDELRNRRKNLEYENDQFHIQTWLTIEEFLEDHGGYDAKQIYNIVTGKTPAADHLKMKLYKQLKKYLEELPNEGGYSLSLTPGWENADVNQFISIPEEELVELLTRYDSQGEKRGPGGYDLAAGIIRYAGINKMEFHNETP